MDSSQKATGELLKFAKQETGVIRTGGRYADGWCRERLEAHCLGPWKAPV